MANIYVRSTDGNNVDSGATWALAKADLTGAAAIDAAGDTIYLSQSHAETTASALTFTLAGTAASPTRIIAGNDAAEPPTTSTTASITTTGNSAINVATSSAYLHGITFNIGSGANNVAMNLCANTAGQVVYKECSFNIVATGATSAIQAASAGTNINLINCDVQFSATGQKIVLNVTNNVAFEWDGGSILAGSAVTSLFAVNNLAHCRVSGVDLSNCASSVALFNVGGSATNRATIRNCKLPASWSGSLTTGTLIYGNRFELYNCDSGDTNYAMQIADYAGSIIQETTIVRTGGANDGTTPLSWKMVSSANSEYPHITLDTPEIVIWNDTTGSAITATVEIVTDGVTLTDAQCWVEVQYLGTSGFPLGSFISDAKADVLTTAANQTTSSTTWTTTGLASPTKQKLAVTFTPQEKGFIHAVVKLAKASTTVYVDPLLTIT